MRLNYEQMQELIDYLQGTCMSIDQAVDDCFEGISGISDVANELEVCAEIDNRIFNCSICGWWCEAGDWVDQGKYYSGEEICSHCGPEAGFGDEE